MSPPSPPAESSEDRDRSRLSALKAGRSSAAHWVWQQYFTRLMNLAQRRMGSMPRRATDEEDIALSAMNSFLKGARAGRFPQLQSENDLWRLLVTITTRKVSHERRRRRAARRGGGAERGESVFGDPAERGPGGGVDGVPAVAPTPEFAVEFIEECSLLFARLDDPTLRDVALWKMQGFTNEEIALKLQRNVRTVERKLALIRDLWLAT